MDNQCHAFADGRILTMDPAIREPEVVVVTGDRIAAAGERALLDAYPEATVHDLAGRTLVPGLIDAHYHLCLAALHPRWADLRQVTTREQLFEALADQAAREPEASWIRGCQWNDLDPELKVDRRDLDALGFDRPVILAHFSYHQALVCSRGLDELGIGRTTPDPPGGEIRRGPDGGPNGVLVETAWSEAHARSLADYLDPDRWAEHLGAEANRLLAMGITAVHDAACPPAAEATYRRLATDGRLPISVLVMPHPTALLSNVPEGGRLDGPVTGEGDESLRVGPMKFFADGGVALAVDVAFRGRQVTGGLRMPGLAEGVDLAVERGWRVGVHAMGNAGLAAAIDAFREAARLRPDDDHRFRVEHATLAAPDQIRDLASLGAIGVVQPGFVGLLGRQVAGFEPDDATWMPFASMADAGLVLAASSDSPCDISHPLDAAAIGATRGVSTGAVLGPEQAVAVEDWLYAYTAGAAYAGGQEGERGSLTPGKRADLVVLDGDLDAGSAEVAETWVGGVRVHRRDGR